MDQAGSLPTLCAEPGHRLHVALPERFTGNKKDFLRFKCQFGLFITANQLDFPDNKSHILFVLSCMSGGLAELWANSFMEKALQLDSWGRWRDFTDMLLRDFGNGDEPRRALEAMGSLRQGKDTATDYFLKLEQLTAMAGVNIPCMLSFTLNKTSTLF
jgi:hypothetical protein